MIVDHGRDQLILAVTNPGTIVKPAYMAVGVSTKEGGTSVTDTALEEEIESYLHSSAGSRLLAGDGVV